MKALKYIVTAMMLVAAAVQAPAQADRHDVRAGNRRFRKDNWREAEISYRKALVKDSMSLAANYNLANALYREKSYDEASRSLEKVKDAAAGSAHAADWWFNAGDVALAKKDYQAAVNAFRQALLADPSDLDAKENYIYARKKLEDQQKNGGGGNDGQNDQQNKDDQNQNSQNNQNKDQENQQNNQDQNQDQNQNGQNQDNRNDKNDGNGRQPVKISPQQAQQMLKAVQAKEKETQDKVNKEKAEALKSRQKDKNW